MSFRAKDLAYEAKQPAFLQRLRAGVTGVDADRHERPLARPRRLKNGDEEDDGPTYVLEESGESMSKAEYESFRASQEQGESDGRDEQSVPGSKPGESTEGNASTAAPKEHLTEIGQKQRKRKAGKIIQARDEDGTDGKAVFDEGDKKPKKKTTKKAKQVKLSFDDG